MKTIVGRFCKWCQAIWPLDAKHDYNVPHKP